MGDSLLKRAGELIEARTRREDVGCRYGGEEFVLILPGAPVEVASRRAEELRLAAGEIRIEHAGAALPPVTVSIGLASFPQHGTTGDRLLRAADDALYRAKAQGRNRAVIYEPPEAQAAGEP